MPNLLNLPREVYLDCLYKPAGLGFYDIKFVNSHIRFTTDKENLIPLEPEKEDEWKRGLVGMMVAEDHGEKVEVCLTDVLLGEVSRVLIPKEFIFNSE